MWLLLAAAVASCMPYMRPAGVPTEEPALGEWFVTRDGHELSWRHWVPDNPGKGHAPQAVIVALHGYNDYSEAFARAARFWAEHHVATYAYDQRGFGGNYPRGYWSGARAMADDVKDFVALVHARYPGVPVYLLGTSMGAAVAIVACASSNPPRIAGLILAAPAVWGDETMPLPYTVTLWLAAHSVPWLRVSGRGLHLVPSDNVAMLRKLAKDPKVMKESRVDTLYGLVNLMGDALEDAPRLHGPTLVLYGAHDEIVPPEPVRQLVQHMSGTKSVRVAIYRHGYHMLLRDLDAELVYGDILSWIYDHDAPLPSGADRHSLATLAKE